MPRDGHLLDSGSIRSIRDTVEYVRNLPNHSRLQRGPHQAPRKAGSGLYEGPFVINVDTRKLPAVATMTPGIFVSGFSQFPVNSNDAEDLQVDIEENGTLYVYLQAWYTDQFKWELKVDEEGDWGPYYTVDSDGDTGGNDYYTYNPILAILTVESQSIRRLQQVAFGPIEMKGRIQLG